VPATRTTTGVAATTTTSLPANESLTGLFGTLAQITAGILSLLAGAVIAYLVFLNDRRTQYDDVALQQRLEIRQELLSLRQTWLNSAAVMLLPSDFLSRYSDAHDGKGGPELVNQMITELVFRQDPMERVLGLSAAKAYPPLGPMRGRAFVVAMNEAVAILTRGRGGLTLDAPQVFPSMPLPGYDEWKRDYDTLRTTVSLFRFGRQTLQADFEAALASPLTEWQQRVFRDSVRTSLDSFERAVQNIDRRVDAISRAELIGVRYRPFANAEWLVVPSLWLVAVAVIGGVWLPLAAMLVPRLQRKPVAGAAIVLTLVPTTGLVVAFLIYAGSIPNQSGGDYGALRWSVPLHSEIESHAADLYYLRSVDRRRILDTTRAQEAQVPPTSIRSALKEYLSAVDAYDAKHAALATDIGRLMSKEGFLEQLERQAAPPGSGSQAVLTFVGLLDRDFVNEVIAAVSNSPQMSLSVEGDRTTPIAGTVVRDRREALVAHIAAVRAQVCQTSRAADLERAASAATEKLLTLAALLEPDSKISEKLGTWRVSASIRKLRLCQTE
jgi:hypothetical protein